MFYLVKYLLLFIDIIAINIINSCADMQFLCLMIDSRKEIVLVTFNTFLNVGKVYAVVEANILVNEL